MIPPSLMGNSKLAYVANGSSGLVVVNFVSIDTQGQAPTVTMTPELADPDTAGIQVAEGAFIPVGLAVQDDIQVSFVELLVNGVVVQTCITFPFDVAGKVPGTSHGQIEMSYYDATLGGTLKVNVAENFDPVSGDFFQLINYKSHTGTFGEVEISPTPSGPAWTEEYGETSYRLTLP